MIRVRFAPSPTGFIHLGNARTALFNYFYARHTGGKFFLRIEDTDRERSKPEYETALKEDLVWLGIRWDEEPVRQSARTELYHTALDKLKEKQAVYPCFCTSETLEQKRSQALKEKRPPRYDGTCRDLSSEEIERKTKEGLPFTYRFKIQDPFVEFHDLIKGKISVNLNDMVGDFVIARQDGSPTFHLAVCVDDADMGITHVIRGEDHLSNTPRHILIFKALEKTIPNFAHMPLILGEGGQPLSKRLGDFSMQQFRSQGCPSEGVVNYMALLGWSSGDNREIFKMNDLIELFSIEQVNTSPARFNTEKFRWVLHEHFQSIPNEKLAEGTSPFISSPSKSYYEDKQIQERLIFLKDSAATYKELGDKFNIVFGCEEEPEIDEEVKRLIQEATFAQMLEILGGLVRNSNEKHLQDIKIYTEALKPIGLKGAKLFKPIRLILTGTLHGPELKLLMPLIPRDLALARIKKLEKQAEK
jgi:glutamyl-tRNA synthetase